MLFQRFSRSGYRLDLHLDPEDERKTNAINFRGQEQRLAGNFSRWVNVRHLFLDRGVIDNFLEGLDEIWSESKEGEELSTNSFNLEYESMVGWECTDEYDIYEPEELESFEPNEDSTAMMVKFDRHTLLAPRTKLITIVFEFIADRPKSVAKVFVHRVYPGRDIGELFGDITLRERRVFFNLDHPGE